MYKNYPCYICLLFAVLCTMGLSSCVLQTHRRVLDTAMAYDGIVVLDNAVYRAGDRYYVQGVQTTLRRSERKLIDCPVLRALDPAPEKTGTYTILPNAPRKTVYRELSLKKGIKPLERTSYACYPMGHRNSPPDDDAPVWPEGSEYERMGWHPYYNKKGQVIAWFRYAVECAGNIEYKGDWLDKLPAGARPIVATKEQLANHPVLKGEEGVSYYNLWERSEARVDPLRALYAYPLAGVLWLVPDAVATVAMHVPFLPIFVMEALD